MFSEVRIWNYGMHMTKTLSKRKTLFLYAGSLSLAGLFHLVCEILVKHIDGTYKLDAAVDIAVLSDYKALYRVGEGRLLHTSDGFHLTGCDGKLDYTQSPLHAYELYADYYWYELGDMICIGNKARQYYCFPKENVPVAKARLAVEELYKYKRAEKKRKQE